ncbi:coiled-coil domain-containing protein 146 isoform X1 [Xiphias gladius]|uniref:coiled-coil domain-containing protein 146 isoform X1 n=1 Tax=Xiphias gladius TaxID=8245 RepID=UPI001A97F1AA|nr:coiled-coil domain-containing protein 146 isoform X1 [Xiphias gladius]XP_039999064.1 coiled-coil domain-containing protein 146 isoform X1 [Xiphias gladius]
MNLSEQQDSRPPSKGEVELEENEEEEERTEEEAPLLALAPDASLPEEKTSASTDVSASTAFQCLDELLSLGKISQTKVAKLKASYRLLHNTLKRTQDSEIQRLGEAKRCRAELERLQAELERTEEQSTSEEPETEVNELRQKLLQAYNELKASEDREYKTQHQLKCLWEEKQYLERENEIQPKPAELESRTKALQDKYEDLKKEVAQRQQEVRSLMEDVETHETLILKEQRELEDQKGIIELKEAEKARLIGVPDQILEKTEGKRSKREAAMKKIEALNTEISEMEQQVKEVEECNQSLRMKKKEVMQELDALQAQVEAGQTKCRGLLKEQEINREEEAEFIGSRGILEMKLQNIRCDRQHLYESQSVQLREKNRQMQALKRMEHALTMATEQLEHMQSIYNELQAKLDAVPKREASIQQRMELQKEVDALKVSFEKQLSVAEEESQKKQQYGMIQELLRESNHLREELHNLRCLRQIKAEERGQKHRELLRAEQLNQLIQHELHEKDLIIMEHNKLNTMLQRRILQYSKLCDMIMQEKIKYFELKQIASQSITELTEQVKVLENEMAIQRTIVVNKDRSLTKARMRLSSSSKMRDKLRNDISKVAWKHSQISQQSENNKLELVKLTQMINLQEQALLEISKNHETAIQRRNFLGIQLLEHEEVLFNYYEKVNIQEAAITKGNMALETMEKEMRDLQLAINEEKRQIDLKKKEVPLKRKLEGEVTMLQIELSEARDRTLEGLNRTVDYRELKGKDPSTVELVKKIEQLDVSLAERERQLLEKELLVHQVTRLSKPLSKQAKNCQQDRLSLGKKLNDLRTHIINTNSRLMAVSAELSMKQATALSQQQEIKEKELQMDRCQRRLEQGLPPCPEIEEEWRRMLRDKKRRQRDKEEREKLAEDQEWNQLPNGEYTTAETRPNAYIPQTDPLPLPKPYGAQAPFKPSQPGANMRHIRKPTLKSLEI